MSEQTVRRLGVVIYRAWRKHFSTDHAKDLHREVKGEFLSNASFKMVDRYGFSNNHRLINQVLERCCFDRDNHPIHLFGAAIYGERDVLKRVGNDNRLSLPVADILNKVSAAATERNEGTVVNLVFDEQLGSKQIAISIQKFVAGVSLANVSHYPLMGVSHVTPGIQLADIAAHIIGRRAMGDERFEPWLVKLRNFEWCGEVDGRLRYGIQRWDHDEQGGARVRKQWA